MITAFGIDPGTRKLGWGVVTKDGQRLERLDGGVIKVPASKPMHVRLNIIAAHLESWMSDRREGMLVGCEDQFVGKNPRTSLAIGAARGAAMIAAGRLGLPFELFPPATVKKAVTGSGKADKDQVQRAVRAMLRIEDELQEDESDALAIAICTLMMWKGGE